MTLISIITISYFFIGLALGFLITRIYNKHFGEGNPIVVVGFCYLTVIGWPIVFPLLLSGLYREKDKWVKKE